MLTKNSANSAPSEPSWSIKSTPKICKIKKVTSLLLPMTWPFFFP